MKFITFSTNNETAGLPSRTLGDSAPAELLNCGIPTPGLLVSNDGREDEVIDLSSLGFRSVRNIIEGGEQALDEIRTKLPKAVRVPVSHVKLHAPIPRPPRIFAIGLNYQRHADESKMAVQKVPTGELATARFWLHDSQRCERARHSVSYQPMDARQVFPDLQPLGTGHCHCG
jgi:hypothetical protein